MLVIAQPSIPYHLRVDRFNPPENVRLDLSHFTYEVLRLLLIVEHDLVRDLARAVLFAFPKCVRHPD
jgi:hypothetical protein